MSSALLVVAAAAQLVSWLKALLLFVTFVPWLWLVSSKLDKDARYFKLQRRQQYNAAYMAAAVVALAVMLFVPIFWVGWPLGIVVLAAPLWVYMQVRNRAVAEKDQFKLTTQTLAARFATRRKVKAANAAVRFIDPAGKERVCPPKDDPAFARHMAAEDLIVPALEARATQVDLSVSPRGTTLTQTIDGIRYKREAMPVESAVALVDYLKGIARVNVEDRRRRQKADLTLVGPTGQVQVSLVTAGSSAGQQLQLIFNRTKRVHKPFDGLGFLPGQLEALRALQQPHDRHGIALFGAPPEQGLSTTGYSLVSRHDAYTCNIKTLEREILVMIDGVDQVQWDPNNPNVDYATNLQSILRRDPDVVLIAELTEPETARIAAEPGMEGPLIYVPLRAASVGEQVRHWVKLAGDLKKATAALRVVINERLLRNVCPNCRQAYQPKPDLLAKMNLPAQKVQQLYRASGKVQVKNKIETCPVCGGTGYFGQSGAFEVFVVGDEERRLLQSGDLKGSLAQARRNKMIYLQEAALSKVVAGETTVEEVIRATAPSKAAVEAPRSQEDAAPATKTGG